VATPVKKNADSIEAMVIHIELAGEEHVCEVKYIGTATNTNTIIPGPDVNLSFKVGVIQFANTFPIDKSVQCQGAVTRGDEIAATVQFNTPLPTTIKLTSQKSSCPSYGK
jgi:hypothetical protein